MPIASPRPPRPSKGRLARVPLAGTLMARTLTADTLKLAALAAGLLLPISLAGQSPASIGGGGVSPVVENPTYVTIYMEIDVDRPVEEVWARVGGYCDIAEWLPVAAGCTILSGVAGEVGSVRSVVNEILVGKTPLSYTYTQPVREGRPYNMYHGTLEARPVTATTSKLVYTLMYDNSMLADDAAREQDRERRATQFTNALRNMKTLAEGGTLQPGG